MTQLSFALTAPRPRRRGGVQRTSVEAALAQPRKLDSRIQRAVEMLMAYAFSTQDSPTSLELATWSYQGGERHKHLLDVRIGLSDAKRQGFVEHTGKRPCAVSGQQALTWRVRQR